MHDVHGDQRSIRPGFPDPTVPPVVDVVVPVHNEERALGPSIECLHAFLSHQFPFSWRITIVDNASIDGTWLAATRLARDLPNVDAEHLDRKGRGLALRAAWTRSDADVVAYMDVDLSTDLDAFLPLVAPLVSGHSDLAIGSRLAPGSSVARAPKREFISRTYNLILRAVLATRVRDAQCGFKAVRADVARRLLPAVEDDGWFFDTELLVLAEHNGLRIHEVPVDWIDDTDSRVHVTRTAFDDLLGTARMARTFVRGGGKLELGPSARFTVGTRRPRRRSAVAIYLASLAFTSAALLGVVAAGGGFALQLAVLAATWMVVAACRFALLRRPPSSAHHRGTSSR